MKDILELDSFSPNFLVGFETFVNDIFVSFPKCYETFGSHRRSITDEPQRFESQVKKYLLG